MDFIVDEYVLQHLPFKLGEANERMIKDGAMHVLNWANWFCGAQDVRVMLQRHPSVLMAECVYVLIGLLALVHALRHGQRTYYVYVSALLCSLCTMLPTAANGLRYDAQSVLTFAGRRVPMFVVIGLQPALLYAAAVVARRQRLSTSLSEGALCAVLHALFSVPYEMAAGRLLWRTWHISHPATAETVPGTSVPYFALLHSAFVGATLVWLQAVVHKCCMRKAYDWKCFAREHLAAAFVGLTVGAAVPMLVFELCVAATVHFKVPLASMAVTYALLFVTLYASADRLQFRAPERRRFDETFACVLLHCAWTLLAVCVVDAQPDMNVVTGMHQPIGACSYRLVPHWTPVFRMHYDYVPALCATQIEPAAPFDFACLPDKLPPRPQPHDQPLEWYTICGRSLPNIVEFASALAAVCAAAVLLCVWLLAKGADLPAVPQSKRRAD